MAPKANTTGRTSTNRIKAVIVTVARLRLPHNFFSIESINGQVATTSIAAQIRAGMNGRSTHKLATIRPLQTRTASVVRTISFVEFVNVTLQ